jgi:two-component system KDP operon response regulator KdpE
VDLILTDFGLPDMNGNAIVRQLRGLSDRMRQIPIIMLTAFGGEEINSAALRAGCSDFLRKPPDFDMLQAMIERLLREQGNDKEDTPNGVQFHES